MADEAHAHVAKWKKDELATIVQLLKESPVIGLANVDAIPSAQMQSMRKTLRDDATVKISKNTLLALALKEAGMGKKGLDGLTQNIGGSTAIIATKMKPHRLYRRLEASKTKAPIKIGQKAPEDITVAKGETPFKPGPIVGELQRAGIPAAIDQGKVVIKQNKTVLKAGEAASPDLATMLARLEIFPMTVGMDLKAVFEDGTIYTRDMLSVDETARLQAAHVQALNLAVFAGYPTKVTIPFLIAKAYNSAMGVGGKLSPDAQSDALKAALASRAAAAAAAPAAGAASAAKEEEKPEEKGPSEEEAMAGLGALFG
ncbi:MAG: large subunit ribosomal protein [Thermoplasmata archaeon]|jgi:large subunit ribosomal protein L10|nr:large subunit ribosomal protein [Thermoplasmata archaeon]